MKKTPEDEHTWPFWPEDAPHPGFPKRLIQARRQQGESESDAWRRIFWEDYNVARQQGLVELEVRCRTLRRFWRRLELLKRRVERPLALLLKALAEKRLELPYEEGRTLVARGQPGARELYELNLIFQQTQLAVELPALEVRRRKDFLEIELRALPLARADSADGMPPFFKYSHRWPRWLPRPLRLTLPLRDVVGSKLEPEAALRRELAMLTQLPFTLRTLLEAEPLEEELRWQLGIVATARWHLVIGFDPPRDRPELLLLTETQQKRRNALLRNRVLVYRLLEEERQKLIPKGMKRLPSSETRRWVERVQQRLFEEAGLTLEELGLRADPRALSNALSQGKRRTS